MNLEHLRTFLAVATHLSFSKAAKSLYIGQSSVSRHIASLEEEVGLPLLIRDNRSVSLTSEGELLFQKGSMIISELDNLENELHAIALACKGTLSIATLPHYFNTYFQLLNEFRIQYPNVNIKYGQYPLRGVLDSVESGISDVGITFDFSFSEDSPLHATPLFQEYFCVMMREDNPLAQHEDLTLNDLVDTDVFFWERALVQRIKNANLLGTNSFEIGNPEDTEQIYMLPLRIKANEGVAVLPKPVAASMEVGMDITYRVLTDPVALFNVVVVWHNNNSNPFMAHFIRMCQKQYWKTYRTKF